MNDRSRLVLVSLLVAPVLVACAAETRPHALEDDVTAPLVARRPAGHPVICLASSMRECKITYVDADGRVNCPTNYQFCNEDGTDWYPCGEYDVDEETRQPIPPKHPSTPKRANQPDAGPPADPRHGKP